MAYNLLKGKKGIIFGALDHDSIAWKVAEHAHEEGAVFTLSNTPLALRFGEINELAEKTGSEVIMADATKVDELENVISKSMEILGGKLDFILQWGSVVALTYVAAQRTLFRYNDMADAKAMLESIARSFGYIYGRDKKIRVNTISQSPTITTAGKGVKGIDNLIDFTERMSPLGNATADECADYCVVMFSDLTKKVTMQNLYHDGGFSSMGMSYRAMKMYNKSIEQSIKDGSMEIDD